jgi:hypothetical protein
MDDNDLLDRIRALVDEERELRGRSAQLVGLDDATRARISEIEEELDRCWDLRRQQQALKDTQGDT